MGFEHGARKWEIPVSDTQAYRQFGNAVVVPVVEAVARWMEPSIMAMLASGNGPPCRKAELATVG
jgi:DNA (cytosine-5)-methyltransferase 1